MRKVGIKYLGLVLFSATLCSCGVLPTTLNQPAPSVDPESFVTPTQPADVTSGREVPSSDPTPVDFPTIPSYMDTPELRTEMEQIKQELDEYDSCDGYPEYMKEFRAQHEEILDLYEAVKVAPDSPEKELALVQMPEAVKFSEDMIAYTAQKGESLGCQE